MNYKIIISKSLNASYNLSLEEYYMSTIKEDGVLLMLWQNEKTIVIGRNQNPWKECRLDLIKENHVKMVRRLSGGGAVYHDIGNLNFTFIMNKRHYNLAKQFKVILDALKNLGIRGEVTPRNDLILNGKKFSGNAFMNKKDIKMHHGTLLVKSDLEILTKYLAPKETSIKTKSVASVRSKVINLAEENNGLDIETLKKNLIQSFQLNYGDASIEYCDQGESLKDKYDTWIWNFGNAPTFTIGDDQEFSWGQLSFSLKVKNGRISESTFICNAVIYDLVGWEFKSSEIIRALKGKNLAEKIICDIKTMLESKGI